MKRAGQLAVAVVALAVLAAACNSGWVGPHAGASQSGFNPDETTIGVGNLSTLTPKFTGIVNGPTEWSPVVDHDFVYIAGGSQIQAFATASSGDVAPSRTYTFLDSAAPPAPQLGSAPTVADGWVYGVTYGSSGPNSLRAFDTTDASACAGTTCTAEWRAPVRSEVASPTVVNGVLYVAEVHDFPSAGGSLQAYSAKGTSGCSGTPRVCTPLWTAPIRSWASPVVVDNRVYVTSQDDGHIAVFDAAGTSGCSGVPKVCAPLWTTPATLGSSFALVVDGRLVEYEGTQSNRRVVVFDAAGSTGCSGVPVVCSPLWTANVTAAGVYAEPAAAYGNVYVATQSGVAVFDLAGSSGCSGVPVVCSPLRTIKVDPTTTTAPTSNLASVSIANGVGYLGTDTGELIAFDAKNTTGCTGAPLICPRLWHMTFSTKIGTTAAIANGTLYFGTGDTKLRAFTPS